MWEKYEKWWILGLIALAIYFFYKKGTPASTPGTATATSFFDSLTSGFGSLVNPTSEPGSVQPAQASVPIVFSPAQGAGVPVSQKVSAGAFTWSPYPSPMRVGSPSRVNVY